MADIVFVVDESRSAEESANHDWIRALVTGDIDGDDVLGIGEVGLATRLAALTGQADPIADVRYGLVGYGEDIFQAGISRYAHSQLFDITNGSLTAVFGDPVDDGLSSGPNDPLVDTAALNAIFGTQPDGNLAQYGGMEDG